jgi:hypothetical protein
MTGILKTVKASNCLDSRRSVILARKSILRGINGRCGWHGGNGRPVMAMK